MIGLLLLLASGMTADRPGRWLDHPEADALEYSIRLKVDPGTRQAAGTVEYRFRALEQLEHLRLDSLPGGSWRVAFETLEGVSLAAERHGDELWVQLPKPVSPGEELRLRARLAGTPPDGLYFLSTRYGRPCVFTDHFPARARGWLPCEDAPADRARFHLEIEAPEGYAVIGTGLEGGSQETELPTYLLAFAVAPYARLQEEGDRRLLAHYLYRQDVPKALPALRHHAEWMRLMEEAFGPYPYERYCVVQVPTRWGGMENAGNTFLMERLFDGDRHGVGTLAHEFAHMWFGDGTGYDGWDQVWLSEGFASYFGPWLDARTGGPSLSDSMQAARRSWLASREGRRLPVIWDGYEDPAEVLNKNAYPKGAWVLHMLRGELGDAAFYAAIRAHYLRHKGRAVGTGAFQAVVSELAGRDMGWFFDQWLRRPGCPELRFEWQTDRVLVTQTQAGDPYRFHLSLAWRGAGGEPHKQRFLVDGPQAELSLEDGPVSGPRVDPDVQLLFRRAW